MRPRHLVSVSSAWCWRAGTVRRCRVRSVTVGCGLAKMSVPGPMTGSCPNVLRSQPFFPRPEPARGGFTTSRSGACQYR
jgi:hypothetical protein